MADTSYSELLTATVEMNLSTFAAKMREADASVDAISTKGRRTNIFATIGHEMVVEGVKAMSGFAEKVMVESLVEVPKHTGVLEASADISRPVRVGNRVRVTMGYGYGDDINEEGRRASQYALPVHEIYDASHEEPTKDHFLLDPLLLEASRFGPSISAAIRRTVLGNRITTMVRSTQWSAEILGTSDLGALTNIPSYAPGERTVRGEGGRFVASR